MKIFAPAKLNLGLRIVGRRADGYHLLESLFWPLRLQDEMRIEVAEKRHEVKMHWAPDSGFEMVSLPPENSNLVSRALMAANLESFLQVDILKKIPLGGGLGGGSSDCGTILKYLVDSERLTIEDASRIATKLGADIPYFLNPVPAWVQGIGEIITPCENTSAPLAVWLLFPPQGIETAAVFKRYASSSLQFSPRAEKPPVDLNPAVLRSFLASASNDLERAAVELMPLLGKILDPLRKTGALYAGMSGSGSTCFALFETSEEREETAKVLLPFYRSLHCKSLFVETL